MQVTTADIQRAFDAKLIGFKSDISVPGETQFCLFLRNHPAEDIFDTMGKEVFLGSVPGSDEMYQVYRDHTSGDFFSKESLTFLKRMVESNGEFSKLLAYDLAS